MARGMLGKDKRRHEADCGEEQTQIPPLQCQHKEHTAGLQAASNSENSYSRLRVWKSAC